MKKQVATCACACIGLVSQTAWLQAEPVCHTASSVIANNFSFSALPPPSNNDLTYRITVVDGQLDSHAATLDCLSDGEIPRSADDPGRCLFFAPGTDGGRLLLTLEQAEEIKQINTYSWHQSTRAPQVYTVYAYVGTGSPQPADLVRTKKIEQQGWKKVIDVDTRTTQGSFGQHIASIADTTGSLGSYRYLLLDMHSTTACSPFGNTFFCELDIVGVKSPTPTTVTAVQQKQHSTEMLSTDGSLRIAVDYTLAPELEAWIKERVLPVCTNEYSKVCQVLGVKPVGQRMLCMRLKTDMGGVPASAGGGTININAQWAGKNRDEAVGAVIHELAHIVQSYPGGAPGWLIEGIADYVRWFLYEPQTKGAQLTRHNIDKARYDSSYRISANFIDWVIRTYDKDGTFLIKLNMALREKHYTDDFWQTMTCKSLSELNDAWLAEGREGLKK
jgi:hypothetical protein